MKVKLLYVAMALMLVLSLAVAIVPLSGTVEANGTNYYVKTTGDNGKDGLSWDNAWLTIQYAVDTVSSGDTINVEAGTYNEGLIDIDKSVSIEGDPSDKPLIKPTEDTITGHTGWFEVTGASTVAHFKNLQFDGSGQSISQCIRYEEGPSGNVENCDFSNIYQGTYLGIAVSYVDYTAYDGGAALDLNPDGYVKDCTFTNIQRIGLSVFGVDKVYVQGNVFNGKGDGDWLDYGVEVGGGGVAMIGNNVIKDCTGVASSDGSTSAGILVTTYFGAGTQATITGNTLTSNTGGIAVGYDGSDTSTVVAHNNNIAGNTDYGIDSTAPLVDAENNWWGSSSGPLHTSAGTDCIPPSDGGWNCDVCDANPDGAGDKVSDGVDYCPWTIRGGCFIATAAYGTSTAEQLDVLRAFRDQVLLESTVGSQFVALYYQISPPVADFISGSSFLKTLVRELLVDPVVWIVEAVGAIWRN